MKEKKEKGRSANDIPRLRIGKAFALHTLKYPYRKVLDSLAEKIIWIHPDVISFVAFFVSLFTAVLYSQSGVYPYLLIVSIFLIIVRMTLNTLDGVIALKIGRVSMIGEMVNALPDRYADIFILIGISLSSLCITVIGMLASLTVLLVSYSGMLGKAIGVSWQHHGPLDKVDRLFLIMLFSLIQFILLRMGHSSVAVFNYQLSALDLCMIVFIILGQITVINRARGMITEIKSAERSKK
ncbi:hypothetical protein AMJ87_13840 [candidate division WOR_3 bacterium SM23_60]|uniref:CDP-alcohol phosphatidyltransferase n=1 Tax=candidate division WOR_3 bacterium SM23_60 TaxID=1703780 RepID=A0A0S8G2A2_UNCW3|nr:MAG: hypothetical protein AMJ87_13840 [candidate division WOR_3 bacterium SM23_60]